MKLRILFTTALLIAISTISIAKEAYAVYTSSDKTLTFYYDNNRNGKSGDVYDLNESLATPQWITEEKDIVKVKFTPSFADARPKSTSYWFYNLKNLTTIENIEYLNTSQVVYMRSMFQECKKLENLELRGFNTSMVESMWGLFSGCQKLKVLDVSRFNTAQVKDMSYMFSYCNNLQTLDLSKFVTDNVESMEYMFIYCFALTSLNLKSFNTSKVTTMEFMFYKCTKLTSLDLSSFNTQKVTNCNYMFQYSSQLTTIYGGLGWDLSNATSKNNMFSGCTSLVGGEGTAYSDVYDTSVEDDSQYAHVDGGEDYPGFFTKKNYGLQVSGRDVTSMNYNNILGNLSAIYDPSTHTLTLNGGTFGKTRQAGVYVTEDFDEGYSLNITVHGKNIMNCDPYYSITSYRTLWIEGNGSIEGDGIHLENGNLWLNDCQINMSSITAKYNSEERQYLWMQGKQAKISLTNNILWFDDIFLDDDDGFVFLQPEYGYYDSEDKCVKDNYGQEAHGVVIASPYGISTGLEALPQDNVQRSKLNVQSNEWYTIDGRKLNGKPTQKGVYIHNGRISLTN